MVRLTDHPDMTLDVYRGRKTTLQQEPLIQEGQLSVTAESMCTKYYVVNCLVLLWRSKPARKSVVRLTDRPNMTIAVYYGHKTTIQQQ